MTSKNSFLISVFENIKRRLWVFALTLGALFSYYEVALSLMLSNQRSKNYYNIDMGREDLVKQTAMQLLQPNYALLFIVCALAFVSGVQAFSYLHNRVKVDFYDSQPVSRAKRFLVIEVAGLIMFVASLVITTLFGILITLGFGVNLSGCMSAIMSSFVLSILTWISVYQLAVLSAVLTGNTIVSLFAFAVLSLYEVGIRALFYEMAENFFSTFVSSAFEVTPVASPFYYLGMIYVNIIDYAGVSNVVLLIKLILLTVVIGLLAYLAYTKRPAESVGIGLSFGWMRFPIKILLLIVFNMLIGMMFYFASGKSSIMMIFGVIMGTVFGHILIETVYDCNFKGIGRDMLGSCIATVISIALIMPYKLDLFGYDKYIPNKDELESVGIMYRAESTFNPFYNLDYKNGASYYNEDKEIISRMKLTDIDALYPLIEGSVAQNTSFDDGGYYQFVTFAFHLKNGKTVFRQRFINIEESIDSLNALWAMPEYKKCVYQLLMDDFTDIVDLESSSVTNGIDGYKPLDTMETMTVYEAFKEDVMDSTASEFINVPAIGIIEFDANYINNPNRGMHWSHYIYPSYKRTISALKDFDIELGNPDSNGNYNSFDVNKVDYLEIYLYDKVGIEDNFINITDRADITAIVPSLINEEFTYNNLSQQLYDNTCWVYVHNRDGSVIAAKILNSKRPEELKKYVK